MIRSLREVLSGPLLALRPNRLVPEQFFRRKVELASRDAHALGDLLDALAGVALHVGEQAAREALELVLRALRTLRAGAAATLGGDQARCAATATATTVSFATEDSRHCVHRGLTDERAELVHELFDSGADLIGHSVVC